MKNKITKGGLPYNGLPDPVNRRLGNTDNSLSPREIQLHLTLELDGLLEQWELLMEQHRKNVMEDIKNVTNQSIGSTELLTVKEVLSLLRIGKGALYTIVVFPIGSTQLINKNLKKIGKAIGLDEVITKVNFQGSKRVEKTTKKYEILSTHMARKTFVTLALEAGMGAEQIRTITGHTSVAQMRPYTGVDRTKVMEGMERAFKN